MRRPRPEDGPFVLDQNFPEPLLRETLALGLVDLTIVPLREFAADLTADVEDWQVILGLAQRGAAGLITNDPSMLANPKVVAVVEQTKFSVVACERTGHDPVVATGLLLTQLPHVSKRHYPGRPQIWRLSSREQREKKFGAIKQEIKNNSGRDVDAFRCDEAELQRRVGDPR